MSVPLAEFQRAMAAALRAPAAAGGAPGPAGGRGFAVHRNTVRAGAAAALADNHPTVRTLLGEAAFMAIALDHVERAPPVDGRLVLYGTAGDGLAATLAGHPFAAEHPWLPDVARLDRAWLLAHVAADAPPLATADLAGLAPEGLLGFRLAPHPAAQAVRLADPWAYAIWSRHREGRVAREDLALAEADACRVALLTRPRERVHWRAADEAVGALLDATAGGRACGEALATLGEPAVGALAALLDAGALCADPA